MLHRCLFCDLPFPPNEMLEHFGLGRRVAYDPARGRLWAICGNCSRWTLAPIEERWEALEELDRLTTDRARLLSKTENIALLEAGPLEIVQVGRAKLAEEAWWRYGRELLRRRKRAGRLVMAQNVVVGAVVLAGAPIFWWFGGDAFVGVDRWLRFGSTAWQGQAACGRCGQPLSMLRFKQTSSLRLVPAAEGDGGSAGFALTLPCPRCRHSRRDGQVELSGDDAERILRRVLAHRHHTGASERRVKEATHAIEQLGSPTEVIRRMAGERAQLRHLMDRRQRRSRTQAVALEIALNDEAERRLLELELAELERRWREEEEIAAIVDRELTPVPLLEALRLKVMGEPSRLTPR